jgi:hypothetical protein
MIVTEGHSSIIVFQNGTQTVKWNTLEKRIISESCNQYIARQFDASRENIEYKYWF